MWEEGATRRTITDAKKTCGRKSSRKPLATRSGNTQKNLLNFTEPRKLKKDCSNEKFLLLCYTSCLGFWHKQQENLVEVLSTCYNYCIMHVNVFPNAKNTSIHVAFYIFCPLIYILSPFCRWILLTCDTLLYLHLDRRACRWSPLHTDTVILSSVLIMDHSVTRLLVITRSGTDTLVTISIINKIPCQ